METKVIRKFFGLADFLDEQDFLMDQHKEGWKLKSFKPLNKYTFEECQKEEYVYQLDYKDDANDEESYLQIFKDCGWEYVIKYNTWYYFRKKKSEVTDSVNSIFSDKESRIDMCKKIYRNQALRMMMLIIPLSFWNVYTLLDIDKIPTPVYVFSFLLLLFIITGTTMISFNIFKLNRIMRNIE